MVSLWFGAEKDVPNFRVHDVCGVELCHFVLCLLGPGHSTDTGVSLCV